MTYNNWFCFSFAVMSRQVGEKRQSYDPCMMDQTAEVVRSGRMSLCQSSKTYNLLFPLYLLKKLFPKLTEYVSVNDWPYIFF